MSPSRVMIAAAIAAGFALAALTTPAVAGAASVPPAAGTIVDQLKELPGVTYLGQNAYPPAGYEVYELEIRQPIDHHQPNGPAFEQHLELYQRDVAAPMVMFLSGYFNYTYQSPQLTYLSDPAAIVGGNQISVETRFYGDSVPHPTLWKYLTIWQEAADEHHVVQVFKQLYHARWLVSGVSKGGEAAIFHDYYYPGDFAGTFAWSAPVITDSYSHSYDNFLAHVGTAACRAALLQAQVRALQNRAYFESQLAAEAKAAGGTFNDWAGGLDENFELTVLATPFTFWQYEGESDCAAIPGASATLLQLYNWYDTTVSWLASDDQESGPFFPYNYQAAAQLGFPVVDERAQLGSLLHYPLSAQEPQQDLPPNIPVPSFEPGLMQAVRQWVLTSGSHLLFLYGQDDPWTSQRFALGSGTRDSFMFTIPGGNHVTTYTSLPAAQEQALVQTLRTWAGVPASSVPAATGTDLALRGGLAARN